MLTARRSGAPMSVAIIGTIVLGLSACGAGSASGAASAAPRFLDATAASGIDHRYDGEFEYFVGGGVAAFDCDGEGRPDLFLAGGARPARLYRNTTAVGGALHFRQVPSPTTDLTAVIGAYPIDIDGDGRVDLAVLRRGGNVLLRGLGDCAFENASTRLGLDVGGSWTTAFSATWEGSNALPTLAFGNYLLPDDRVCDESVLVRPEPGGDTYGTPIALGPGYCTLSLLFSDWSRSGRRDLRITNDRHYYVDGSDQLWRIAAGQEPRQFTAADGWRPLRVWGMGIASQDLTGDGLPEVFVTSQGDNKLQSLEDGAARPSYIDIALERGVIAQRPHAGGDVLPSTAWHPEFEDVNNDGFVDLFVSKGNVEAQVDYATRDPNNLLLQQPNGEFVEGAEEAGIVDFDPARGATLVDLDLDGLLDLVVVKRRQPVTVWHNLGAGSGETAAPMGHWLALRLIQPAPNVDAVGAWVEVRAGDRTTVREITVGGGHAGGKLGWIHVGLGSESGAQLRVQWPDGEVGPWIDVTADEFVIVERGRAEVQRWRPQG